MAKYGPTEYQHYACGGEAWPLYYDDRRHSKPVRMKGGFYCPGCDALVRSPLVLPAAQMQRVLRREKRGLAARQGGQ